MDLITEKRGGGKARVVPGRKSVCASDNNGTGAINRTTTDLENPDLSMMVLLETSRCRLR